MAINTNVSPLGARRIDPSDPRNIEELRRLSILQGAITPSELIEDPRANVRAAIPEPYVPFQEEDADTREMLIKDVPPAEAVRTGEVPFVPQNMDEVGALASREGIPSYMPTVGAMPILGEEGESLFNPETGEDISSPIGVEDYQGQLENEVTGEAGRASLLHELGRSAGDVDQMRNSLIEQSVESWETEASTHPQSSQFLKEKMDEQ